MLGGRGTCLPREFGLEHLDGDLALVLEVVREVHGGHAAVPEFARDAIAVGQCDRQAVRCAALLVTRRSSPPADGTTHTSVCLPRSEMNAT